MPVRVVTETSEALNRQSPVDAAEAHLRFGDAALKRGDHADAAREYAKASRIMPNAAAPYFGLGLALAETGQFRTAIAALQAGLEIDPTRADAHFALARLFDRCRDADRAVAHYDASALHAPDWPEPHLYKAALYDGLGDGAAAYDSYGRALKRGAPPGFALRRDLTFPVVVPSAGAYAHAREAYARKLHGFLQAPPRIDDPVREAGGNRFFLAYQGLDDRPLQQGLAYLMRTGCPSLEWTAPHCAANGRSGGKRRLGIASRFLHDHSIGRLMAGLLSHLSRRGDCDITLFHAVTPADDAVSRELRSVADASVVLPGALDEARRAIAERELDILFYPDIGMDPVTYFLAFARLAPVQCATWGHPVTTGIPAMDYYLSCDAAEPDGADAHYSERLVRLGGLPFSYRRAPPPVPLGAREKFGLSDDATVYFLAQSLFKVHPDMDAPLADILRQDPKGLLLLLEGQQEGWGEILRRRFDGTLGPLAERVVFLPRQSHEDYMRLLALADVSLDSFPFSGGNTTYQALAMGTPVVTLPGDYLRGRLSLAIYRHMGMTDCVAADAAGYARIAVRLGTDAAFRSEIETRIAERADTIFDDPVFLKDAGDFLMTARPPDGQPAQGGSPC